MNTDALSAQVIALAGLFQALEQVQHCARYGEPSAPDAMRVVLESVLRIDAPDTLSVYGKLPQLQSGLSLRATVLWRQCGGNRIKWLLLRKPMQRVIACMLITHD